MKVLLALSGGLDSAVLLAQAVRDAEEVQTISFQYNSKHNMSELLCARKIANHFSVENELVDVTNIFQHTASALLKLGKRLPEGHFNDSAMKDTVVPGRNLIFASILGAIAQSRGIGQIWLGMHAGDATIYPDCRPAWVDAVDDAVGAASDGAVQAIAPFLRLDKAEIVRRGLKMSVPFQLTWTCYAGGDRACGKCGSCVERRFAFQQNDAVDPVPYIYNGPLPTDPNVDR